MCTVCSDKAAGSTEREGQLTRASEDIRNLRTHVRKKESNQDQASRRSGTRANIHFYGWRMLESELDTQLFTRAAPAVMRKLELNKNMSE